MLKNPHLTKEELDRLDNQFEETFGRLNKILDIVLQQNKVLLPPKQIKKPSVSTELYQEPQKIQETSLKAEAPAATNPDDTEPKEEVYECISHVLC